MQQHPVPQNVTQYQFRLVGDMTLKQFLELAGGLLGAYLFYSSNLVFIVKWPLAIMSILFGFGLAFFPIEDRPLDQWIINFIRSIYAPTRYIWKKSLKIPSVFTFEAHPITESVTVTKTVKAPGNAKLSDQSGNDLSDAELARLQTLDTLFSDTTGVEGEAINTPVVRPVKPSVTVRKLKPADSLNQTIFVSTPRPPNIGQPQAISLDDGPQTPSSENLSLAREASTVRESIKPEPEFVTPTTAPSATIEQRQPAVATSHIRLPAAPSSPNLIVGMVVDKAGKIIENTIVEILSEDGIPQRAIKTNSLGQFYTSTPLARGNYLLGAEKDGYTFPTLNLIVENQVIAPILIQAEN